jgi:predicted DNA-binding protein (MmcQ/YjbR family)
VTRDIKWDTNLVFSVGEKMFAMMPVDGSDGGRLSFKVEDDRFLELTDQPGIIPAPYLARARWVSVIEPQRFDTAELASFIRGSYSLVRARLTRKLQASLAEWPAESRSK